MQQKTIKTTETVCTAFSMIPSKAVITELGRLTYIVFLKSVRQLLTKPLHKVFLLPGNTVDCWKTGLLVVFRYREHSTQVGEAPLLRCEVLGLGPVRDVGERAPLAAHEAHDVGFGHHRWQGQRHHCPQSAYGQAGKIWCSRRGTWYGWIWQCILSQHKCHGFQCYSCLEIREKRSSNGQPLLYPDTSDMYSGFR